MHQNLLQGRVALGRVFAHDAINSCACAMAACRTPCVHMSIALLGGSGLALLFGIAWVLVRTFGRREPDDLGTISDSWINQHRANTHDAGR
jgi:hypothetical protein